MMEGQGDDKPSGWRRLAERYECTSFAYFVQTIEPLGILIAPVGLAVTAFTLVFSWVEFREGREVREATLFALATERLEAARAKDAGYDLYSMFARTGQIRVLERMVRLGISLRGINASRVNFVIRDSPGRNPRVTPSTEDEVTESDFDESQSTIVVLGLRNPPRGINLAGADLTEADSSKSNLAGADLTETILTEADLERTNLSYADLTGANLAYSHLMETNVSKTNFAKARGLTQSQLDQACADPGLPPANLPLDIETNQPLIWKDEARSCS